LTNNEGGTDNVFSARTKAPDGLHYVVAAMANDEVYDDAVRRIRLHGGYFEPGEEE
jgi:hypothetical protein